MRKTLLPKWRRAAWGAAIAVIATSTAAVAQSRVLPAGTVIFVRTTTPLQSATAKTGQTFETNVEESIGVDEYTVIPTGSKIRGLVTMVTPATRQQSGVIDIVFDRLTLPNGSNYAIRGKLTSTDSAERRQIASDPNGHVVLVGGRGGIGAAIAAAGSSQNSNNIFAALGNLLSEGRDVNVPTGTQLAVELENAVTLRGGRRITGVEASTIYTAAERVSAAQRALSQQGYYRGSINGQLDDATRNALFQYQIDRGLNASGNLDGRTARALGINLNSGVGVSTGVGGALSGAVLSASQAAAVRRDAQSFLSRVRSELSVMGLGRLNSSRAYSATDIDLWFAASAFADNAAIYEQIVNNSANADAAVLAGRSLADAARRVDTAIQNARPSTTLQNSWYNVRQRMTTLINTSM
ncbi:MAG TPA: peptidoglycan-binding domain-containing protein [Gemmatimonadaceae bacterium]|nr:peptidoglycan-binding domain-containing protein [Gemmatimonadaceae bacterium]